ncbi:glutathione S-transferase family protein [Taklimakanibacter deserti]|uniref:glutathione S-transferase family protein n=1 Tax=Taklimakanibacter deserti TaxID=2267839 RepID=UPI0013C4E025
MIEVWGRRSSSNVQKVVWALDELGLPFDRQVVGGGFGGNREPGFLEMNPNGLVPVLKDGDITMFESNAIVRYLAARYGEGTLRPKDAKALAMAEQWMEWQQLNAVPPISAMFWHQVRLPRAQRNDKVIADSEANLAKMLPIADKALSSSPWFAGDSFSFGDIVLGVLYWRYFNLAEKRLDTPHIQRWFEALQQRPAYRKWVMVEFGRSPEEWTAHEKALG